MAGAWANTGMSLVDQNMIPFRTAYLVIVVLIVCVLAGNTAFVRISLSGVSLVPLTCLLIANTVSL